MNYQTDSRIIENMNRPVTSKLIKLTINNLPTEKSLVSMA